MASARKCRCRHAGADFRAALVAAVVERADDVQTGNALGGERMDEQFAIFIAADDDGAAIEPPFLGQRRTMRKSARRKAIKANNPST